MKQFSQHEYGLIYRALMLLAFVTEGRDSNTCLKLSDYFASECRASQMMAEDDEPEDASKGMGNE